MSMYVIAFVDFGLAKCYIRLQIIVCLLQFKWNLK